MKLWSFWLLSYLLVYYRRVLVLMQTSLHRCLIMMNGRTQARQNQRQSSVLARAVWQACVAPSLGDSPHHYRAPPPAQPPVCLCLSRRSSLLSSSDARLPTRCRHISTARPRHMLVMSLLTPPATSTTPTPRPNSTPRAEVMTPMHHLYSSSTCQHPQDTAASNITIWCSSNSIISRDRWRPVRIPSINRWHQMHSSSKVKISISSHRWAGRWCRLPTSTRDLWRTITMVTVWGQCIKVSRGKGQSIHRREATPRYHPARLPSMLCPAKVAPPTLHTRWPTRPSGRVSWPPTLLISTFHRHLPTQSTTKATSRGRPCKDPSPVSITTWRPHSIWWGRCSRSTTAQPCIRSPACISPCRQHSTPRTPTLLNNSSINSSSKSIWA